MRISILDPSLHMLGGHFTDLDLRLAAHWAAQGHAVTVHGQKNAAPPLGQLFVSANASFKRTFTYLPFDWSKSGFDHVEQLRLEAAAYHQDLMELETADLIVWPSASASSAMAHALYGLKTPAVLTFFEHPGFNSTASPGAFAASRAYMQLRRQKVVWGLHVEDFMPAWNSVLGPGNIQLLPYPTAGKPRLRKSSKPLRIGFAGALRLERRSDLMVPLIQRLLDKGFAVSLQDSLNSVPAFSHDRLERFEYLQDITPVIAACDLVIWPAMAERYLRRPSGIVAESIACGVPLVMSSACYPSEMAITQGAAVFFQRPSLEEILEAVDQAAARIGALREKALLCAKRWNRKHGLERLADGIFELAGLN
jgi:glycosyltransferase involved in cell wall biosynthesis